MGSAVQRRPVGPERLEGRQYDAGLHGGVPTLRSAGAQVSTLTYLYADILTAPPSKQMLRMLTRFLIDLGSRCTVGVKIKNALAVYC